MFKTQSFQIYNTDFCYGQTYKRNMLLRYLAHEELFYHSYRSVLANIQNHNYPSATLTKRNGSREWRIQAGNEVYRLASLAYCALLDFASFRFACIALLALLCWHCFALLCLLSIASRGIANEIEWSFQLHCIALFCNW
jgi:hypothetical protein